MDKHLLNPMCARASAVGSQRTDELMTSLLFNRQRVCVTYHWIGVKLVRFVREVPLYFLCKGKDQHQQSLVGKRGSSSEHLCGIESMKE
jgi:hypothetical protein